MCVCFQVSFLVGSCFSRWWFPPLIHLTDTSRNRSLPSAPCWDRWDPASQRGAGLQCMEALSAGGSPVTLGLARRGHPAANRLDLPSACWMFWQPPAVFDR